jgi:ABC-2 type transport system ATP-binding protein
MQALSLTRLTKTYKNGFTALKGVDLTVEEGDFFALLGPNGAGKSTLIGIVSSLVNKSSGRVTIFDKDIEKSPALAKACLGLVPQEINLNIFETPFEIVVNQGGYYGLPVPLARQRAEKYLNALGLWEKRSDTVRMLSGGMKRRLMIARALVHEPRLLILDEPTAGVDIEIRQSMWRFLRELNANGTTIILTTHYLEEAESLCKNIAIINTGSIIEHTRMETLLRRLQCEGFILYLKNPLTAPPELSPYRCHQLDPMTLEVYVQNGQTLNDLFTRLSAQQIEVASFRNKTNRLEELFLSLVGQNNSHLERSEK